MSRAQPTLAGAVAARLESLSWPDLPPATVRKAKLGLLDYLANALSSRHLPWGRQAIELAGANPGPAAIVGTATRSAPGDAAFANAVLGHGLVRDDMHLASVSHLGTVVFPALLATCAGREVTGKTLLAAAIAGYEAGGSLGRLILDVDVAKIFRPTGITGPFAASAAVAKLLTLDARQTEAALVFAANSAAGYNEWAATGGSEMFFHVGFAARNALSAVALAQRGAYASASGLDGPAGLLAAFGKLPLPRDPLGNEDHAEIMAVFFKEVPACNFAQTAAQVARDMAQAKLVDFERVTGIEVRVPRAAALYPGCDRAGPFEHILQAKMSIHYNVAAALTTGRFDEASYVPSNNPEIVALAAQARVTIDEALTQAFPAKQGARVLVELSDGESVAAEADDVKPASDALVRERFVTAATATLGNARATALLEFVDTLEARSNAGEINRLAAPSA